MVLHKNNQNERWLAIGLLLVVIGFISFVIILPLVNQGLALHEEKNALGFRFEQYERILSRKQSVIDEMETLKAKFSDQNYLSTQNTSALASAELQEMIKQAIIEAGGQLSSTQGLPVVMKNNFNRIPINVRMTGNSEVLRAVLHKIETATPLVVVEQIDIRPMRGVRNKITHQIDPSNELSVNFQAISFMKKSAS
ncbi:MAG: type II secretion system protein GspM [Methylococcales bacterium]|nr:type II secretion system protein GspM [Methylococcales bacterium]